MNDDEFEELKYFFVYFFVIFVGILISIVATKMS